MPNKPIKLLMINDILEGGGAEKSMVTIIHSLYEHHQIDIHLALLENGIGFDLPRSVKVYFLSKSKKPSNLTKFYNLFSQALMLRKLHKKEKFDLVLSFQFRSNFTNVISKLLGVSCPIIISERAYAKKFYNRPGIAPIVNQRLIKWFYPKAECVLVNSQDIMQGLIEYYKVPAKKIVVINNGYNKNQIRQLAEKSNSELDKLIKLKGILLVNVGRVEWEKGQEYLIHAMAHLKQKGNYQLVLVGKCNVDYKNKLVKLIHFYGLQEQIHFTGFLPNPYPYIAKADVFVFTSLFEGYPNALAEAVVLKKPVVSFDIKAGVSDIIISPQIGEKVGFGDSKGLALAIESGVNNRNVIDYHILDEKQVGEKYFELIHQIIHQN